MSVDTFEGIIVVSIFIIPGFIIDNIVNAFCPYGKRKSGIRFLYCIFYGLINIALFGWLYVITWNAFTVHGALFVAVLAVIVMAVTVVLGLAFGLIKSKRLVYNLLVRMHIDISSSVPTAWDYVFSTMRRGSYVVIELKGGKKVYGLLGTGSYVSSEPDERDIYLEKIFECSDPGDECSPDKWKEIDGCDGMIIAPSQIENIKFIGSKNEEKEN